MGNLYIAAENIPAGHAVVVRDPRDGAVYGYDMLSANAKPTMAVAVGTARENIREGFRVYVDEHGNAREDDA